ncbi:UDP-3-O-(3-hydroxymyristoyl)glucosamine N-acyltransferase [Balneatrix alpica]|uniref:UDP-3-O-acylglucosamine N-acyltransferase n=1 Tax=Balneatrix alpica TaxID=75684 RepID=A0ABV5ZCM7_9GAMM|nr:UDP-3-O-(3-hydroxymyristoyl)glucosamine N-acyltransferase [Balneatrix alpica]
MASRIYTLAELADFLGAALHGDGQLKVAGLATLKTAQAHQLSFLANPKYVRDLAETNAAAVILSAEHQDKCPVPALVLDNPYLGYAKVSHLFLPQYAPQQGVHPTAVVAEDVRLGEGVVIGPGAVVGAGSVLEAGVEIGAQSVVGRECHIGAGTRLQARVTLYDRVSLGARCIVHSGAVIGSDGFGFAQHQGQWIKIAQLGGVIIEDDVEIGANTTIDSGALEPTRLGAGVKVDNQVQIAHNVQIGEGTAIAGCVGIAGSAVIGRYCTLAGGVGVAGHLEIADRVHVTGMSLVSASIREPGIYSSGTALTSNQQWRKNVARFRNLDDLARRLQQLEKQLLRTQNEKGSLDDGN